MSINKKIITVCTGLVLAVGLNSTQAALMNFSVMGDIVIGQELYSNIYNLSAGDTVTLTGTFDDTGLTSGTGTVYFDINNPTNSFSISLGAFTESSFDDISYASGGLPAITFNNYQLVDMDFLTQTFNSWGLGFDDQNSMYGEWRTDVQFSPVPAPAALWLLVSGLIGLAGFLRKRE